MLEPIDGLHGSDMLFVRLREEIDPACSENYIFVNLNHFVSLNRLRGFFDTYQYIDFFFALIKIDRYLNISGARQRLSRLQEKNKECPLIKLCNGWRDRK